MPRPKGSRNVDGYKHSPATITQRQNAAVKSLENRKVVEDDEKRGKGQLSKPIKDGYKHLTVIKQNVDCSTCEIRNACKYVARVLDGELNKCPLYPIYRNAIVDVTQNPLMYLSRTAGRLEVAIAKQAILDKEEGKPISKEMLAATKIALDAVKIAQIADGKGKRMQGNSDETIIIDAEAFGIVEEESKQEEENEH